MITKLLSGAALLLAQTPQPAAFVQAATAPAASAQQLSALADEAAARGFSGVVLVARDGNPIIEKSYGLADRATGEKIGLDTQFGLASLDKFITRLAIFQLLQAGRLQLSDTVGEHLPDLPNDELKRKVTIQHLLDMKGGVPSFWNSRYMERRAQLETTSDYLDLFAGEPLRFEPGTKREYSNGGFVILGAIVERLSGLSYEEYVRKNIAAPAAMHRTGLFPNTPPTRGRAIGYTAAPAGGPQMRAPARDQGAAGGVPTTGSGTLRPNTDMLPLKGSPAGGGYSTARDLLRLDMAIRSDRLLEPRFTDLFLNGSFRRGEGGPTGWNGGTPGANVQFVMYPDGVTLIVLANQDPPAANRLANLLAQALGKTNPFG